jgi:hypothetical protein
MSMLLVLLGVLFIGLKLGGVIMWTWWLVLLPLYGGFVLVVALLLIAGLLAMFAKPQPVRRW